MRLLILGGIPYKERPATFGGTTVLMQNFLDYCSTNNIAYRLIATNRYSGNFREIKNLTYTIVQLLVFSWRYDCIMFNASSLKGCYTIYPIVLFFAKMSKSKVIFRRFAGSLKRYLEGHKARKKIVLFCLRNSDLSFFETKEQVEYFRNYKVKCKWFPNVRERMIDRDSLPTDKTYCHKFVFMGHVKKTKGVGEILSAFSELSDEYHIDIYGRLDDFSASELNRSNVAYKGVLEPKDVCKTLLEYDALVLPSYMEGYPGIVIEAFSVGLPVIVTNVGGIPEIVENKVMGYIIPPRDYKALIEAIKNMSGAKYTVMSKNALAAFDANFDSERVNLNILREITNLR